jgi:hypothetical protein
VTDIKHAFNTRFTFPERNSTQDFPQPRETERKIYLSKHKFEHLDPPDASLFSSVNAGNALKKQQQPASVNISTRRETLASPNMLLTTTTSSTESHGPAIYEKRNTASPAIFLLVYLKHRN